MNPPGQERCPSREQMPESTTIASPFLVIAHWKILDIAVTALSVDAFKIAIDKSWGIKL